MELILDFAKRLLKEHIRPDSTCADFTMGNGYDTLFLAQQAFEGQVYSFDIQPQALEHTKALLEQYGIQNVQLILDSHSHLKQYISAPLDGAVFNLGYLPNGDKTITTQTDSTLTAVQDALSLLSDQGILVVVLYPGHAEGAKEAECLETYFRSLNGSKYDVIRYDFINKNHPPYLIAVQKRTPASRKNHEK